MIRKRIDEMLNRFGYYKSDLPEDAKVSAGEIEEMFTSYGANEMFVRFLRDLCAQDVRLYFQASNEVERNTLRGAWSRTNYFISLIQKTNDKRKPRQGSKRSSGRGGAKGPV